MALSTTLAALSQNDRWSQTVRYFVDHWHSDRLMSVRTILGLLTGLLLVLFVLRMWQRHKTQASRARPAATFLAVAWSLRLRWRDQWLLLRVARQQRLPSALTLLLSPATLQHHAQRYVATLARHRRPSMHTRMSGLHRTLYRNGSHDESGN